MSKTYEHVFAVAAENDLDATDLSACLIIQDWHENHILDDLKSMPQHMLEQYQKPLLVSQDSLGVCEASIKMSFDKDYNRKMIDFYESQIIPRLGKRLSANDRINLIKYKFKMYGPKSIDDILEAWFG